jgi:hypothetical protein
MPYFLRHKILYIHIPKCYGTSIVQTFQIVDEVTLFNENLPKLKPNIEMPVINTYPQHYTFKETENFDLAVNHSFATVRNPYERIISQWKYQKDNAFLFPYKKVNIVFKDWVYDLFKRFKNGRLNDTRHDMPQTDFIFDANDRQLVNEIIKCEGLSKIYGLTLFHSNKSMSNERPEITFELKRMIDEVYKRDFELLEYSGELDKRD